MRMPTAKGALLGVLGAWVGVLALLGILTLGQQASPGSGGGREEVPPQALSPCSAEGSVFAQLPFEEWAQTYHGTVEAVIAAEMQKETAATLTCTTQDQPVRMASPPLQNLAASLPPWAERSGGTAVAVTAEDTIPVLLEYVRIYECSLLERQLEHGSNTFTDELLIGNELAVARPALERTLLLLSGRNRLRPLTDSLTCVERSLVDIRNVTGLLAEASACWNRTWDARESLRDIPPTP